MKTTLLLVTLSLAIVFTGSAFADEAYDKVPPARVLKAALNLSEEQGEALGELIKARVEEVKAINEDIHELEAQLKELLKSETPDQAEVGGLVLDISELKQEIRQGHEAYQQSFRDMMTAEQTKRLGHINQIALADRAAEVLRDLRLH